MKTALLFFGFFLSAFGILSARSFYLDSEKGSDLADGSSPQKAWKTLQKLNQSMSHSTG